MAYALVSFYLVYLLTFDEFGKHKWRSLSTAHP